MRLMLIGFRTGFWLGVGYNKQRVITLRNTRHRTGRICVKGANGAYAERLIGEVLARSGDVQHMVPAISLVCNLSGDIQFVCSTSYKEKTEQVCGLHQNGNL